MPTPVRQDRPFEQEGLPEPILSIQTVPTFDAFPDIGKKRRMLGRFRYPQGSEDKPDVPKGRRSSAESRIPAGHSAVSGTSRFGRI